MSRKAASGSGSIRKKTVATKSGKSRTYWEGRAVVGYDGGTGKPIRKSVSAPTQSECRKKLAALVQSVETGTYVQQTDVTVEQWLACWITDYLEQKATVKTLQTYRTAVNCHINPAIGAIKIQRLTAMQIQRLYSKMTDAGLSAQTVRITGAVLKGALKQAVRLGMISDNPALRAELPARGKTEVRPLQEDEIPRFLHEIHGHEFENAYKLCLFVGLRRGEALGLSWDNVDLERSEIRVCQQLQEGPDGLSIIHRTKSGRPRTIRVPEIALISLRDERSRQLQNRLRAGQAWDNPGNLVFTDPLGGIHHSGRFYYEFKKIAEAIGRPELKPHDLRHSAATVALANGVDVKSIQQTLGHSDASMTLNVYLHATEQMKKSAADKIDSFYDGLLIAK